MLVFKTAIRLVFRYPIYLLIYIVMFGLLGLIVTGTPGGNATGEVSYEAPSRPAAVIDRDNSEVSKGLVTFLDERTTLVELADDTRAMQDAMAQNTVPYILIIPKGYGEEFLAAAKSGKSAPELQSIVSVEAVTGVMMDEECSSYLNALRVSTISDPDASAATLAKRAQESASIKTPHTMVQSAGQINQGNLLPFYFKWSCYPLSAGIAILVALTFVNFQSGELRRRNLASPLPQTTMSLQISVSCLVIALMTWAFVCLLSLVPIIGGLQLLTTNPISALLIALAALVYTLVPLAIGFLFSQLNMKEMAINGFVNIVSLSMMFLSGIMMGGSSYLNGFMLTLARFVPAYWYSEAIEKVASAHNYSLDSLGPYFVDLGLVLLFAVAIFSVSLLIGRLRVQTAQGGGNTAAEAA